MISVGVSTLSRPLSGDSFHQRAKSVHGEVPGKNDSVHIGPRLEVNVAMSFQTPEPVETARNRWVRPIRHFESPPPPL